MASVIVFRDLSASVRLGWTPEERTTHQSVLVDLRLEFEVLPQACESDRLQDTVCYGELARLILGVCARKEFHLLEHLGAEILKELRLHVRQCHRLTLRVTKPQPPITALRGGVSFIVGDNSECSWQ